MESSKSLKYQKIENIFFSIIVPTLKRPDTLFYTLKTILENGYLNIEIIVSDNFSNDATKDVVDSFKDSRIKYFNTGEKLSMARHWEFALAKAQGDYVTILGDDDGLINGALAKVAKIINKENVEAVGWRFANFNWEGLPPYFMIPMSNYYEVLNSKKSINKIITKKRIIKTIEFPSLYGGFIKNTLLKEIKNKYGGVFFHSRIPDFFSGGIIAANIDKYIRISFPITINATSKHSTGFAALNDSTANKNFEEMQKNDSRNIPFHENLIFIRSIIIPISEAMLQVNKLENNFPKLPIEKILTESIQEAISVENEEKYHSFVNGIKEIAKKNGHQNLVNKLIQPYAFAEKRNRIKQKFSIYSNTIYFNTSKSDVRTVYDAVVEVKKIIPKNYFKLHSNYFILLSKLIATVRYLHLKLSYGYKKCI